MGKKDYHFVVTGMHCGSCEGKVKKALMDKFPRQISDVTASAKDNSVVVHSSECMGCAADCQCCKCDPCKCDPCRCCSCGTDKMMEVIEACGFKASFPGKKAQDGVLENKPEKYGAALPVVIALSVAPRVICGGIAWLVHRFGNTALYESNIAATMSQNGRKYLYAAAAIYGCTTTWLNMYPLLFKQQILPGKGNVRANSQIYKTANSGEIVVLEDSDTAGSYNRANRSLTHFTETGMPMVLNMALAGVIYPFPTMVCTAIYGLGRILHQTGYAKAYGKHGPGFVLGLNAQTTLEMLCVVAAAKA